VSRFASSNPGRKTRVNLSFVQNSKKRQLQPGSEPTSSISAQTGWKPILHYAVASSRGYEKVLSGALESSLGTPKSNVA
jgi:hypothetical protein